MVNATESIFCVTVTMVFASLTMVGVSDTMVFVNDTTVFANEDFFIVRHHGVRDGKDDLSLRQDDLQGGDHGVRD